jgi:hypothetical protein
LGDWVKSITPLHGNLIWQVKRDGIPSKDRWNGWGLGSWSHAIGSFCVSWREMKDCYLLAMNYRQAVVWKLFANIPYNCNIVHHWRFMSHRWQIIWKLKKPNSLLK